MLKMILELALAITMVALVHDKLQMVIDAACGAACAATAACCAVCAAPVAS